jgi:hypothetical protein
MPTCKDDDDDDDDVLLTTAHMTLTPHHQGQQRGRHGMAWHRMALAINQGVVSLTAAA